MLFSNSKKLVNWVRYSGISLVITVNPMHWQWVPRFRNESSNEWPRGENEYTGSAAWLFLTVRVWVDDGNW